MSPAGGNFEEPVTQATLKVVGAFHGLSRARSDARRFPAIDPLDSWSKYKSIVPDEMVQTSRDFLVKGSDVRQMMMVVGEEGTSIEDFVVYLKSELLDSVYLQQNAFDKVDAATNPDRQQFMMEKIISILQAEFTLTEKEEARTFFYDLRQKIIDWNYIEWKTDEFKKQEQMIDELIKGKMKHA